MSMKSNIVSFMVLFYEINVISAMENGFTVRLAPRKKECFYEKLTANTSLDLEYQVIEGGELDINFEILDPNGQQLIYDSKASDDSHEINIKTTGVYTFCLDNSFSTMTTKTVYLDLGIENDDDWETTNPGLDSVFKVYTNLEGIRAKLGRMSNYQGSFRAMEARQRYYLEGNNSRVMWVSSFASIVMIIAGLVQVYFVRRLFDDKSRTRI